MVKYTAQIYQSRGGVYSIRESANQNEDGTLDESETGKIVIQSETEDLKSVISYFEENEVFELGIKLESGTGFIEWLISYESDYEMSHWRNESFKKKPVKDGSRIDRILVVSKLGEIHYLTGFDVNQSESSATIGPVTFTYYES